MPTFRTYIRTKQEPAKLIVEESDDMVEAMQRSAELMNDNSILSAAVYATFEDAELANHAVTNRPPSTSRTGRDYTIR